MYLLYGLSVGLMIMLSFVGWGQAVAVAIFGQTRGDWPFQAVWGASLLMVFGGVLNMLGLVGVAINGALILAGLASWCFFSIKRGHIADWRRTVQSSPERVILFASLGLFALMMVIRSLIPYPWNISDDSIAYAAFPVKMLETGALIEPFSWRRLSGFGGYSYLHSLVLTFLPSMSLQLLDRGLITALTGFAITYYVKRRLAASWLIAGAAGMMFMVVDVLPRVNLSPTATLCFLAIGLLETVQLAFDAPQASAKRAWLVALVAAGFASVRVTAIGFEGIFLLLLFLVDDGGPAGLRERLKRWGTVGILTSLLLVPWAISLYQSSHTPLWPLFNGNFSRALPNNVPFGLRAGLAFLWQNIRFSELQFLAGLALCALVLGVLPKSDACFAAGAVFVAAQIILSANQAWPWELWRYYVPFTRIAWIITGAALVTYIERRLTSPTRAMRCILGLCLCGCAAGFFFTGKDWTISIEGRHWFTQKAMQSLPQPYARALATVPPGAKILAEVEDAYLLDYRQHEIFNIDEVGMASPAPGLPVYADPEKLVQYLSRLSIEYIIFVRPAKAALLYNRKYEERTQSSRENNFNSSIASNYLWFFDTVERLARTHPKLFEDDNSVVICLKQPLRPSPEKTMANNVFP